MYLNDHSWTSFHSFGTSGSFSHKFLKVNGSIVGFGVGVVIGVGTAVWVGVGDGVGLFTGAGFGSATPLFQTNFFPLFTHVYFLPLYVEVAPAFEHFVPGATAATDS
jgi:hypothetical protein